MKRFLYAALCGILLQALAPALSPPGNMATSAACSVDRTAAYVGDTITWTVYGVNGIPPYHYFFDVYRGGALYQYDSFSQSENVFRFTLREPGAYFPRITVTDNTWYTFDGPVTKASFRFTPVITGVEALSGAALKLTWSASPGADGCEVWYSTSKTNGYTLAKATTTLGFTKTYLSPGTRYFFKVRAYNLVGGDRVPSSAFSAPVTGVPLAKPVILSATATGVDRVKLVIAPVAGASGYRIYTSATAAGTYKLKLTTTASTVTVTGLKPGTSYYFKVRAYRRIYTTNYYGPLSAYKAMKTPALGKAVISSATATGKDRVKLVITPVAGASGYRIYSCATAGGTYMLLKTIAASTLTIPGLTPNTQYYFKAQAYKRIYTTTYTGPMSGYKAARTLK